jgi:hypothetical protein
MRAAFAMSFVASVALAQPVDLANGKFRNITVTGTESANRINATFVDAGTVKAGAVDAGVLYVAGSYQLGNACLNGTTSAITLGCNTTTASNTSLTAGTNGTFILGGGTSNFRVINVTDSVVTPTVVACSGTAASMLWNNGSASFRFDVGTACAGENTAVVTLPTAANCWTCSCFNVTTSTNFVRQTACTTTTATITNFGTSVNTAADWTDGNDIQCMCRGG